MEISSSKNSDVVFVYVTFPNRDFARKIGREAVEARLAACANIFSDHESIYQWKGELTSQSECAVIFKTSDSRLDELSKHIVRQHPYETPCLAVLSPAQINEAFAAWVRSETTTAQK
ncbi:divalent-cation tolerance protein CutA [soil metagenome]